MYLKINQDVIFTDDDDSIKCYVKRINKTTVTLYQRQPKLEKGRVRYFRVPIRYLKKYVSVL